MLEPKQLILTVVLLTYHDSMGGIETVAHFMISINNLELSETTTARDTMALLKIMDNLTNFLVWVF